MIEVKLFEVRDIGTCIPACGVWVCPATNEQGGGEMTVSSPGYEEERWLLRRSGWGAGQEGVYIFPLDPGARGVFAMGLVGAPILHMLRGVDDLDRTYTAAFTYIAKAWHELVSGQVVDVRVILGEQAEPAPSDRRSDI
jgi:hypothetical protein